MARVVIPEFGWRYALNHRINFFLVGGKNYSWQLHEGHDGEIDGLGSKIGPNLNEDTK